MTGMPLMNLGVDDRLGVRLQCLPRSRVERRGVCFGNMRPLPISNITLQRNLTTEFDTTFKLLLFSSEKLPTSMSGQARGQGVAHDNR
jgi:hypothetical protein